MTYEKIELLGELKTWCPYDKGCMVGSCMCHDCKHHIEKDPKKLIVKCGREKLEKLKAIREL